MRSRVMLLVSVVSTALLAGCGDTKDKPATQTVAKVNKEEITVHQVDALLQQRGARPEQADDAARRALERLIDQELAVQKAGELKLDREPRVMQAIEAARRDIIARAYADRIGEGAAKPTPVEIKKYYADNPALFAERRIYQLQELAIEAPQDQIEALRAKLRATKNINEFAEFLKASKIKFVANQAVRSAEQLPLPALPTLAGLKDGESVLMPTPAGAQVVVVAGSRLQPVDEARATPFIEQFLLNERKRRVLADDLKALRTAAQITYVGKFAASAPPAPEATKSPTPAELAASAAAAASSGPGAAGDGPGPVISGGAANGTAADAAGKPASGGVDAATIGKGLGLK